MNRRVTVAVTGLIVSVAIASPSGAELAPPSGTFTGYYRVDRWGLHTFAGMAVDPRAQAEFKDYRDTFVTADVTQIDQFVNPGPWFVRSVGKITRVRDIPVEIKLNWADEDRSAPAIYRRIERGATFKFTVTVTNKLDRPLGPETVRSDGFILTGIGGANLPLEDTQWDMTKDIRFPSLPSREWQRFNRPIDPGKSDTWTMTVTNARPGEYEFYVYFMEYWQNREWRNVQSNWLRLDVVNDRPQPTAGLEVTLIPDQNPPRPPRSIPARIVFRNASAKPVNFFLPYRKDKLAGDLLVRCFDSSGAMIQGSRPSQFIGDTNLRGVESKPQRLEPGKSTAVKVYLPDRTTLASARLVGSIYLSEQARDPDEEYLHNGATSASGYVRVRR